MCNSEISIDNLEAKLDEADHQAAETQTRYDADEVFERIKKNISAGDVKSI